MSSSDKEKNKNRTFYQLSLQNVSCCRLTIKWLVLLGQTLALLLHWFLPLILFGNSPLFSPTSSWSALGLVFDPLDLCPHPLQSHGFKHLHMPSGLKHVSLAQYPIFELLYPASAPGCLTDVSNSPCPGWTLDLTPTSLLQSRLPQSSSCWGHEPWYYPWFISLSHIPPPKHQQILLALPLKNIQDLTRSHSCCSRLSPSFPCLWPALLQKPTNWPQCFHSCLPQLSSQTGPNYPVKMGKLDPATVLLKNLH